MPTGQARAPRARLRVRLTPLGALFLLACLVMGAWSVRGCAEAQAQQPPLEPVPVPAVAPLPVSSSFERDAFNFLVNMLGLGGVGGSFAWWLRGVLQKGIPVEIRLHPSTRRALKVLQEDDSDDDEPRAA